MKTTQEITKHNEIITTTEGIKGLMRYSQVRAIYGIFEVVGKEVVHSLWNVTANEADTMYTDDLIALRNGNVTQVW